ncbi:amino acid racemase [Kribbella pittospori]|uniref:Amino acid racemase n=1 Tax=Kribbella pittospori TaxID=722689 RepID=A0A4R0K0Q8_9ACTN|nr:amino acid racemase [Kribbella pittospori]TCC52164.1 amino acid racemase [Kribbella pittospori]
MGTGELSSPTSVSEAASVVAGSAELRHAGILAHTVEGAALCFLTFCQEGFRVIGPHHHPDVTLDCIALGRSLHAWESGDYASVRTVLAQSVDRLVSAGADFFVCPCNTAHLALEEPGVELPLPGLHIADVVAEQAVRDGRRVVGVLGTKLTMDGPIYRRALAARGIRHVVPSPNERELVDWIIYEELVNGVISEASREKCLQVIRGLEKDGCDVVALACTEIPLLISGDAASLPLLDSTRLLAVAAFDIATGRRPMPSWRGGPVPIP